MKTNKKEFIVYLAIAFGISWGLQFIAAGFQGTLVYQILAMVMMYAPFVAVWIAKRGLKREKTGVEWGLKIKKNWKWIVAAWFLPAVLTVTGGILYYLVFPDKFDAGCGYARELYAGTGMLDADGNIEGMSIQTLIIIQAVSGVFYAPLMNMFFALGEEVGWRGYMTPVLIEWMGKKKALIVSGIIWALWHAPLIVLTGYEYGTGYVGEPFLGVAMMCVFATSAGILLSYLYEKTNSIWVPSIAHGAINAICAIPIMFMNEIPEHYLLGPTSAGLLSGLPMWIVAGVVFVKMTSVNKKTN